MPYFNHDDVIKWKHFPRYWAFVWGIHRSPVNSPHKGQWRRALMFSLICARINGWVNNGEAGDLRRHRSHYDVIVMNANHVTATDFIQRHSIFERVAVTWQGWEGTRIIASPITTRRHTLFRVTHIGTTREYIGMLRMILRILVYLTVKRLRLFVQ